MPLWGLSDKLLGKNKQELTPEQRQEKLEQLRKEGDLKDTTLKAIIDTKVPSKSPEEIVKLVYDKTKDLKTVNNMFKEAGKNIEPRDLPKYLEETKYIQAKQQDFTLEQAAKTLRKCKGIQRRAETMGTQIGRAHV